MSTLSPEAVEVIRLQGQLFDGRNVRDTIAKMYEIQRFDELVENEVIEKRNDHLAAQIEHLLLTDDHLIVPWGAMHAQGIACHLEEMGFTREDSPFVRLFPLFGCFRHVSDALMNYS